MTMKMMITNNDGSNNNSNSKYQHVGKPWLLY